VVTQQEMIIQEERPPSALKAWLGVAAITASLFVFLTTELMPVGLLTPLSKSLDISVGVAGLMVTAQGVAAGLGVPFIVAWTRRVNRRLLLSTLLAILALGNLITAISPNYALILTTRLIMGFASGVFWAIGVSMAMRIVPERQANRAAAVVMSGISIATVVGIPLGTIIESLTDWRTTFVIWAGLSVLVFLAVTAIIPSLPSKNAVSVREVFGLPLKNVQLRTVLFIVVFFVLGHFGAYTFVRPFLEDNASATPTFITVVLIIFGVGGAVGNFIAGYTVIPCRHGDHTPASASPPTVPPTSPTRSTGRSSCRRSLKAPRLPESQGLARRCRVHQRLPRRQFLEPSHDRLRRSTPNACHARLRHVPERRQLLPPPAPQALITTAPPLTRPLRCPPVPLLATRSKGRDAHDRPPAPT
jgi:MFS family permease